MSEKIGPDDVVTFWRNAGPSRWFTKDDAFDEEIRSYLGATYELARTGARDDWANTPYGALALILILDQVPRNIFRNDVRAFETDGKAVEIANLAISRGFDWAIEQDLRRFVHMPFMHSETMEDQWKCIDLCRASNDVAGVKYAAIHAEIIEKFGRFPHRNPVFGRQTTPEEQAFLDEGGFAG